MKHVKQNLESGASQPGASLGEAALDPALVADLELVDVITQVADDMVDGFFGGAAASVFFVARFCGVGGASCGTSGIPSSSARFSPRLSSQGATSDQWSRAAAARRRWLLERVERIRVCSVFISSIGIAPA